MVELVYKFDEKFCHECELISKARFKFFLVHKYYIYIYIDTNIDHFTPLTLRVLGNKSYSTIETLTMTIVKFICVLTLSPS